MDKKDVSLLTGSDYWFVGPVMVSDGPHGLRKQEKDADFLGGAPSKPAVCYPTASALACSFDRELLRDIGRALGDECLAEGISVLLGPGVNHKRSPRCGRNFEYFSEDPVLTGELAAAMVDGIQSRGVGACVKHFAGNSREWGRMVYDSIIGERALFEIYLRQFEIVVKKAHPVAMMAAYNKLGGVYCTENERLLCGIAREKWGFNGVFLSDWGAVSDPVKAAEAGLDVVMPGPDKGNTERILRALDNKTADAEKISARVENVKRFIAEAEAAKRDHTFDEEAHLDLARRAAAESAVLLKNGGSLPLRPDDRVLVVGSMAKKPRFQGAGSSRVIPVSVDCVYDELARDYPDIIYAEGYPSDPFDASRAAELREEACRLAGGADRVVVVAGLPDEYESEGYDRRSLAMPDAHNELISALAACGADVTVVLQCGAPVETPWADSVSAILVMYLSGCRGGAACADLLTGRVSPSGRLAESWPMRTEDDPSYKNFDVSLTRVEYPEGIFTGYRYYDTVGVRPRFPFGAGLSYTSFRIDDASASEDEGVAASCRVTNTGDRAGALALCLYVSKTDSAIPRPAHELKDFTRVFLEPGETLTVSFPLSPEAFEYYDDIAGEMRIEKGDYSIYVGSSPDDLTLCGTVTLEGSSPEKTAADFLSLTERREIGEAEQGPFTPDSPAAHLKRTRLGRMILRIGERFIKKGTPMEELNRAMVHASPLRMLTVTHPRVTSETVEGLVLALNGKFFRGVFRAIRSLLRRKK